jgi:potassium channel
VFLYLFMTCMDVCWVFGFIDFLIYLCGFRLLLFTAVVTPYRVSFSDEDPIEWIIVDSIVDSVFAIDIILNFFSAYYDSEDNLVTNRKQIALKYLRSWLLVDFLAIIPISLILNSNKDYNSLARVARLPRLYRLLKTAK